MARSHCHARIKESFCLTLLVPRWAIQEGAHEYTDDVATSTHGLFTYCVMIWRRFSWYIWSLDIELGYQLVSFKFWISAHGQMSDTLTNDAINIAFCQATSLNSILSELKLMIISSAAKDLKKYNNAGCSMFLPIVCYMYSQSVNIFIIST